jgi:hypothetical protein
MKANKELEDALIDAAALAAKEGGMPDNCWHPDYGWFIWDGKCTLTPEEVERFIKQMKGGVNE